MNVVLGGSSSAPFRNADLVNKPTDIHRLTVIALRRIHSVLSELELNDIADRVPNCTIVLDTEVFESVDESSLHVAALLSPYGCVHQAFSAAHRVEKEFNRVQAGLVRGGHKAPGLG